MFGKNKIKQMQEMLGSFQDAQAKLQNIKVEGNAGAGAVKVTLNGRHDCLGIEIDPEIYEQDRAVAQELIAAAFNDAVRKLEGATKQEFASLAQDFGIPTDPDKDASNDN